jgi:hypothetical protein
MSIHSKVNTVRVIRENIKTEKHLLFCPPVFVIVVTMSRGRNMRGTSRMKVIDSSDLFLFSIHVTRGVSHDINPDKLKLQNALG